ncbi:MAG: bifunctional diaminohydroxyphosphoribosylaminopyrimidine deaminase/5-amino-6-(5-phosphoribosylamino)uracil reductase RibD [Cyanobacteria bacterium SIG26]|nr:bifunctional diaminohydroxyphosphoribosylaminopyrimidine deaminase/5-amino-6-(5-phosphoribosylamino)uracil reductase RibD [Cyanobacteria bacterium SIG26]
MQQYFKYMYKCIELARQAQGETSPNPLVGCVIIDNNGEIVSTGYHKKYGQNHAERDALLKLDNAKDCTLVVNLEPCSHQGKTPPCTDIIIEKGIKTVVYGMKDPNPIVAGKGLEKLKNAGIEIVGPVLEDECKSLNEAFVINHTQKRTFVALKTATTIDGKIATYNGDSKWITSDCARKEVKNIRYKYDAILTSSATVIADNPTMEHKSKIVLDRSLKTDFSNAEIYKQGEIFVFYDECLIPPRIDKIHFIPVPVKSEKLDVKYILNVLFELKIMSILVETGGVLNGSFMPYIDKLYHFIAPKVLGDNDGRSCFSGNVVSKIADCKNLKFDSIETFEPDILITYKSMLK